MPPKYLILPIALLALLFSAPARAAEHAQAQLLADVSALTPGKPFTLGIKITLDPGWHVYWKNPGESGLPTKVKFTLPDGFVAGDLQYPTPRRFVLPGNITIYGYEDSVMLLTTVTPPKDLPANFRGDFSAKVTWLVCADVCMTGGANVKLSLPAGISFASNIPDFKYSKSQIPVPASDCADLSKISATGGVQTTGKESSGTFVVEADWNHSAPKTVDFFPGAMDLYDIKDVKVASEGDKTRITFAARTLAGQSPDPANCESVIAFTNDNGEMRGAVINISFPRASSN